MLAGLSPIDPLQQRPMLAVMRQHVCPNGAPRRHEDALRAVEASARHGWEKGCYMGC
jgi:hypothetical protein